MAKVKSDGKGIQTWSQLPLETIGDYRELGFVHGSNREQALGENEFPHSLAEHRYRVGYDYGVTQRNAEAREYAAANLGRRNTAARFSTAEHNKHFRSLKNGSEEQAYQAGCDFEFYREREARTIREAVGQ